MPDWLQNQLRNAFQEKNKQQIRLLNQCWYYYYRRYEPVAIRRSKTK
ncbi:cortex morphogenetic protein CmpA [Bacillaceae bacterium IKA-2]|nr:cortex morphogenetic protein CmpA [Bacillaceae bacterium IKA-2]